MYWAFKSEMSVRYPSAEVKRTKKSWMMIKLFENHQELHNIYKTIRLYKITRRENMDRKEI